MENYRCPNCGAGITGYPNGYNEVICRYCNARIRLRQPTVENLNIVENAEGLQADKVAIRVGRLIYTGEYESAKELLQKTLAYHPEDRSLLELESVCNSFLTRNFGNYLKMLSVRTFFAEGETERYRTEIDGFCRMLGSKADRDLNIPLLRKQNSDNYIAIIEYISLLKKCLQNGAVMRSASLYESVRMAVLKMTAVVCNTIYLQSVGKPKRYVMLMSFACRRQLKADFEVIASYGETAYRVVDEKEIRKYISEG
ncbi:MAG: hypothetical protein IJS67_05420 [Clostridia bacterium]|nr:hypothetical protein [Clostridia bacterium]